MTGTVQGVGFRPFVLRTATDLGLGGHVLNDEKGVVVEAEGSARAIDDLIRALRSEAPPLAVVESVTADPIEPRGEDGFRIAESERRGAPDASVSADTATCKACLAELWDPEDRRHRYPFINCTDCGPRFTIVRGVPYDRPLTTMADFRMCAECQSEYDDPLDRRFHAQPNACRVCGPKADLVDPAGGPVGVGGEDPIASAAEMLAGGAIVAVKGIGGYHLACDATDERAVAAMRARKHREQKPFALMAPSAAAARDLADLTDADAELLQGKERPIVIARRRDGAGVAASVAPGSRDLGVMLPYAPLQHLLLSDFGGTLVMTSANLSDEPIAFEDEDALHRLGGIAAAFLVHDRPIATRTDDSVVRSVRGMTQLVLRRSRGYVPRSIALPISSPPVLGCGAELKSAFCVAKGMRAWPGPHIGDLKNWETLTSFREGAEHFERLFAVAPTVIAHDLHPDFLSTRYAEERAESEGAELVAVQHHHAHLAACLAEYGETGPALGVIFDGTGYGPDGTVWGGELLAGDMANSERVGMLMPVRLPGGDRAIREPWRMAVSWLSRALDQELPPVPPRLRDEVSVTEWEAVAGIVQTGAGSPVTTSAGRLFDAVAVLCGVSSRVTYEGQAAAELEGLADPSEEGAYEFTLEGGAEVPLLLDPRGAVSEVMGEICAGIAPGLVAARFHNGLAIAAAKAAQTACRERGLDLVVLSGGVFQNRMLLERTRAALDDAGLRTLVPALLPPNDGGIAFGQVATAAASRA